MFPRPPKLPPRPREVAMQVVQQKVTGAVNPKVLIVEKKPVEGTLPLRPTAPSGKL